MVKVTVLASALTSEMVSVALSQGGGGVVSSSLQLWKVPNSRMQHSKWKVALLKDFIVGLF